MPCPTDENQRARRALLQGGAATLAAWLGGCAVGRRGDAARLGFASAAAEGSANELTLAPGYQASVLAPWGEPVGIAARLPAWKPDASNSAAEQALQLGMGHGDLRYVPIDSDQHGLLVIDHEGSDSGLLFTDGAAATTAEKVAKAQAAQGISVVEVVAQRGAWQLQRPSPQARRIGAATATKLTGPAAGHFLLRTAADATGRSALGVLAPRGALLTPWGSVLVGEGAWAACFDGGDYRTADQRRWDLPARSSTGWSAFDGRFDARKHPNEVHRFGWIVEFDPREAAQPPYKRTALGRGAHAGIAFAATKDGRAVVYRSDGEAFGYVYRFVSRDRFAPGGMKANTALLDQGTLHVARFDADGSGRWLPLQHGQGELMPVNGFADAGELLIKTRQAADRLGATKLDRPAALAVHPVNGEVFCALAGNDQRGGAGQPGADAANPRAANAAGHILRWRDSDDVDADTFSWKLLLLAGNPADEREEARGDVRGDAFVNPQRLAFDSRGLLWIGAGTATGTGLLLACDIGSGEVRRFLSGPAGSAIGGMSFTPDGRTMFVDIQHPGANAAGPSDPIEPTRISSWPGAARPRSATVAVRRRDGGAIGG